MKAESNVSPRFGGGSGLKPSYLSGRGNFEEVSPRFGGGSGLKHCTPATLGEDAVSPLASAGGVD